jgi:hypothetical protein
MLIRIRKLLGMSAAEIMEKVKALPESERRAFTKLFHEMEQGMGPPHSRSPVKWPDIQARQRAILGPRVLPENVVLAARREERW